MDDTDRKQIFTTQLIIVAVVVLTICGLYLTRPTEKDIHRCVETSNYTYEQCRHKMSL